MFYKFHEIFPIYANVQKIVVTFLLDVTDPYNESGLNIIGNLCNFSHQHYHLAHFCLSDLLIVSIVCGLQCVVACCIWSWRLYHVPHACMYLVVQIELSPYFLSTVFCTIGLTTWFEISILRRVTWLYFVRPNDFSTTAWLKTTLAYSSHSW